jgi:hypothetical protein
MHAAALVRRLTSLAVEPVGGRWTAAFERVAIGVEVLKSEIAVFADLRADAVRRAVLGVDDGVGVCRDRAGG